MGFQPSRLTVARAWAGLRLGELASRTSISAKSIGAYESGESPPTDDIVQRLATTLHVNADFFYRPLLTPPESDRIAFRARTKMDARTRDRASARVVIATDVEAEANKIFSLPKWATDVEGLVTASPERSERAADFEVAEAAARALRAEWGLGDKRIPDMVRLLEAKGVRVFSIYDDPLTLDAFSYWHEGVPLVFLSLGKTGQRQRFDAAHELGHLILHQQTDLVRLGRKAEPQADLFASAFLMPPEAVVASAPRNPGLREIDRLRHKFAVSIPAMAHRLYTLKLLSEWQYKSLCVQMSEKGLRTHEPDALAFESSTVWRRVFHDLRQRSELNDFCASIGLGYEQVAGHVFRPIPTAVEEPPAESQKRNVKLYFSA